MQLKIISQNVRVFQSLFKRMASLDFLASKGSNIVCVQECRLSKMIKKNRRGYGEAFWSFLVENRNNDFGDLIKNMEISIKHSVAVEEGRCVCLTLSFRGLINIYAHDRLGHFEKLEYFLHGKSPTIVISNLNCVLKKEQRTQSSCDWKLLKEVNDGFLSPRFCRK